MMGAAFTERVTIVRQVEPGAYVDGVYRKGATQQIEILASVQPERRQQAKDPEGEREDDAVRIYTTSELRTSDEDGLLQADVLLYNGREYEIVEVARWTRIRPHYAARAILVTEGAV